MPQPTADLKVERKLEMSLDDVIKERKKRRRTVVSTNTPANSIPKSKKRKTINISTASLNSGKAANKNHSFANPRYASIKSTGLVTTKGGGLTAAPKKPGDARASAALSRLVKRTQLRQKVESQVVAQAARRNKAKGGAGSSSAAGRATQNGSSSSSKDKGISKSNSRSRNTPIKSRSQVSAASSSSTRKAGPTIDLNMNNASPVPSHVSRNGHGSTNGDRLISFLPEPDCVIRVSGLHSDALEDQIKIVFTQFGPVTKIKMEYDSYQRFVGVVYVTFKSVQSAERAVSQLHGKVVDGKTLSTEII